MREDSHLRSKLSTPLLTQEMGEQKGITLERLSLSRWLPSFASVKGSAPWVRGSFYAFGFDLFTSSRSCARSLSRLLGCSAYGEDTSAEMKA